MKKIYDAPEILVSVFSPKESIALKGISLPEEGIEDEDGTIIDDE